MMDDSLKRAMKLSHEQKILLRLVHGELVAKDELLQLLYGDDPDGGPMWAESSLNVAIVTLRGRLQREGWDLETVRCYGLDVGKGRVYDGCPSRLRATRSYSQDTSGSIEGRSSPGATSKPSLLGDAAKRGRFRPTRSTSQSASFELGDFLSNPSQVIAS
jgi:DNA-binding winged helix-turn-helix (wHTH) protein